MEASGDDEKEDDGEDAVDEIETGQQSHVNEAGPASNSPQIK